MKIGTRGSKLALAQAGQAKAALEKAHAGLTCELVIIKTTGDDPASAEGQRPHLKGLFVKEIEEALLRKEIDMGVHSVKDLEPVVPAGLQLAAVLKRDDPRDALILAKAGRLVDLPADAQVAAGSVRRQAQLKRLRRDLEFVPVRGNVDTRLRKLDEGQFDALVLAACGLQRLGLSGRIQEYLNPQQVMPCPGQGAIGLEIRQDDKETARLAEAVNHADSYAEVAAERALLAALGGNCDVPLGALARAQEENLTIQGVVLSPDGLKAVRSELSGPKKSAGRLGKELASHLRAAGADRLLYGAWRKRQGAGVV
ncbi:MAG: hydroxymethylbilane synthase [Candidatus Omnitrophica bacterium]|nr:hydroxymethylbilane synthase [Candidatus Omnitrophota bacterium]